ncbi:MAG: FAD-dependent oxidoreductase [Alphaproteobacteria bacterium]
MRLDLRLISEMISHDARVLDIGCGDGALIEYLAREKRADARGIEIDMAQVTKVVSAGLAVIHGDADNDLAFYPDGAFDYVVLSRTLQAVEKPREVLRQLLRIGRHAIVSFPNFGHWQMRWRLLWGGRISVRDRAPTAVQRVLLGDLRKVYPQLTDVRIEFAWSGLMSYARHEMPQIGRIDEGLWLAQAFGGHGVAPTPLPEKRWPLPSPTTTCAGANSPITVWFPRSNRRGISARS